LKFSFRLNILGPSVGVAPVFTYPQWPNRDRKSARFRQIIGSMRTSCRPLSRGKGRITRQETLKMPQLSRFGGFCDFLGHNSPDPDN
jgi:hypothetical protein